MENIYTKERVSKEQIEEIFIKLGVTYFSDIQDMTPDNVIAIFEHLKAGELGIDDRGEYFILKQQNIMLEEKAPPIHCKELLVASLMKERERGIERYEENAE